MKVLMHDGHVLTLPFTSGGRSEGTFDQLDADGTPAKGVVSTIEDGTLPGLVNAGAARENAMATPAELRRDLRFIHKALIDVAEGAEIGIEPTRSGYRLLVPEEVRVTHGPVAAGNRCAFNAQVAPRRCSTRTA